MQHGSTIVDFFGWMLLINIVLFVIGLLKVTTFKRLSNRIASKIFGEQAEEALKPMFSVLWHYWILIIVFNLVPYLTMRIVGLN
jgi:hypothetical protein